MTMNPLFWLHSRISGSTRTNTIVTAAYAGLVLCFTMVSYYVVASNVRPFERESAFARLNATWLVIMTGAQGIFLLLVAPSALRRAVQRDFESGMMESHRLTPMSNSRIVLGYLVGCPIQALMLYAVSLIFGTYFAGMYGGSPGMGGMAGLWATIGGWYFAQGCMLVIAAMVVSGVLLSALATRGKSNIAGVLMLIGVLGGWFAILFIPGLALVLGVLSAGVLFNLMTSARLGGDPLIITQAAAFQVGFCLIFFAAACGKLRRPDKPLFSLRLGLLLAATWGGALIVGMRALSSATWLMEDIARYRFAQWICSTVVFAAVCYFALWAASANLIACESRTGTDDFRRGAGGRGYKLIPVLSSALTVMCLYLMYLQIMAINPPSMSWFAWGRGTPWVVCGLAWLLSFWTDFHLMYALKIRVKRPLLAFISLILAIKGIPLLIDQVIEFLLEVVRDSHWVGRGYISGVSPVGTLLYATVDGWIVWSGLIIQTLIATIATALGAGARRRLKSSDRPRQETGDRNSA